MTEQTRQTVTEKIAYKLSEDRKQKGISGTSEHDFTMAEIELMNYEFFTEKYRYITQIIRNIVG